MSTSKKVSLVFLAVTNLMSLLAGLITQIKLFKSESVDCIIPINAKFTDVQTFAFNFILVVAVIFLISVVTTYLVTDIPYSPLEIIKNCPAISMIIPVAVLIMSVINAVSTTVSNDKVWLIVTAVAYVFFSIFNFGCISTIREDAE
jgi:hypothetical protein